MPFPQPRTTMAAPLPAFPQTLSFITHWGYSHAFRQVLDHGADNRDRRFPGRKKYVTPSQAHCRRIRRSLSFFFAARIIIVGALTFLPALALGPIAEHLTLYK